MNRISLHLANTRTGDYDTWLPLPKPLHADPRTGNITRTDTDITQIIGFTSEPDDEDLDLTWLEWVDSDPSPFPVEDVIGLFPVVIAGGEICTLTVPVSGVSVDGRKVA